MLEHFKRGFYCILDIMLLMSMVYNAVKKNNNVPIVFLTAKKLKEDVLKGYGAGGDDYVTKPFDTEIRLKIRAILASVTIIRHKGYF
jgi:DNA-binding response OmpR family regulator